MTQYFKSAVLSASFLLAGAAISPALADDPTNNDFTVSMDVVAPCELVARDVHLGDYFQGGALDQVAQASNVNVTCGGLQAYVVSLDPTTTTGQLTGATRGDTISYTIHQPVDTVSTPAEVNVPLAPSATGCATGQWNDTTNTYEGVGAAGVTQHLQVCYQIDNTTAEAATPEDGDTDTLTLDDDTGKYSEAGITLTLEVTSLTP